MDALENLPIIPDKGNYISVKTLCERWSVSPQSIRNYQSKGLMPVGRLPGQRGTLLYDSARADMWYTAFKSDTSDKETMDEAELRLKRARASAEEYKLSVLYKENIDQKIAIVVIGQVLTMVDKKLKEVSVNAGPLVAGIADVKECIKIIDNYIEIARSEIASADIKKLIKQTLKVKDGPSESANTDTTDA